ncbi:transposase InsO family protein [Desulfohalotomaculum tongense]|nr:transposase InsO family protein [Desulforadius tongensis]
MRDNGITGKTKRKYKATTNSKHNYPFAENLINQNFNIDRPNQIWAADNTDG